MVKLYPSFFFDSVARLDYTSITYH